MVTSGCACRTRSRSRRCSSESFSCRLRINQVARRLEGALGCQCDFLDARAGRRRRGPVRGSFWSRSSERYARVVVSEPRKPCARMSRCSLAALCSPTSQCCRRYGRYSVSLRRRSPRGRASGNYSAWTNLTTVFLFIPSIRAIEAKLQPCSYRLPPPDSVPGAGHGASGGSLSMGEMTMGAGAGCCSCSSCCGVKARLMVS